MNAMGRMPGRASPTLRRLSIALLGGQERPARPASTWRFSLEQAGTGERRAFRDLRALVDHLEQDLGREDFGTGSAGAKTRGVIQR